MNTNHLEKLEYNKILENLSSFCTTKSGKNLANKLLPSNERKSYMTVFVRKFNKNRIVLSRPYKSNKVQVQIGIIKTNVPITKNVKSEINVIGLNVEETIFVVDKFLDDAPLTKFNNVKHVKLYRM